MGQRGEPTAAPVTPDATTATPAPSPTGTVSPVPSVASESSPEDVSTEPTLIQYARRCGDMWGQAAYRLGGCEVPSLIIYTDGQAILMERDDEQPAYRFMEAWLSTSEMCGLLSEIEDTGFFQVAGTGEHMERDPIYRLGDEVQYGDGLGATFIQVNGDPHKAVYIYHPLARYLVPEVRAVSRLLSDYRPQVVRPYVPEAVLMWVELDGIPVSDVAPMPWPAELPSLAGLLGGRDEGDVVVEGELADEVMELFGGALTERVFIEGRREYYVVARPVLPHESERIFYFYPGRSRSLPVPLACQQR